MQFNKKQGYFLQDTIEEWTKNGTIDQETADRLRDSFVVLPFDWKKLAKYSFWVALICGVSAFGAVVADAVLIEFIEMIFSSSSLGLCVAFGLMAAGVYYLALKRRKQYPEKIFSNESLMFMGVFFTAVAVAYLGKALSTGGEHFSLLFLLSTFIYACLGLWFPSQLIWVASILSLGAWFGTETGYVSGWGAYYLGMNYPLRFVLFGGVLVGASFVISAKLPAFFKSTYVLGLLYLFIALWLLSIFGNYGDASEWQGIKQIELFHWGLLFAFAAMVAIYYGLRHDDYTSRSFGITFLFINLYTKYFEYFWDATHKAVFFFILALSFWFLGSRAESIWNLAFLRNKTTLPKDE